MTDRRDVRGQPLVSPPAAAEQELSIRQLARGAEEEFLDTRFTVGQSIAKESKVGLEPRLGQHGMMRRRIQRIVDRNTRPGPERLICADDGIAAAVGEYEI